VRACGKPGTPPPRDQRRRPRDGRRLPQARKAAEKALKQLAGHADYLPELCKRLEAGDAQVRQLAAVLVRKAAGRHFPKLPPEVRPPPRRAVGRRSRAAAERPAGGGRGGGGGGRAEPCVR
jgi:hypothetical protein